MARYFVTGATGFLGAHLVDRLVEEGHSVVALCREDEPELEDRGVSVVRGDVLDAVSVSRALTGAFDGTFHVAGRVSRRSEDAEALHRLHVEGTRTVLAASKTAGVRRVVVASTSGTIAVSQDPSHVVTEADPSPVALLSRWPYYRSKLYAEQLALAANGDGLEVICVNPTLLLGPGDARRSSTEDVRLFLERRIPAVPAGGMSFVDVRDAADGMALAMTRGAPGRRYLLSACNLTVRDFFAKLARISGVRAPWLPVPQIQSFARSSVEIFSGLTRKAKVGWLAGGVDPVSFEMAQFFWYVDAGLAERELGWKARDPMLTLRETVDDILASSGRYSRDATLTSP